MNEEIIIAGFGGQGVLSMGKILAYAGMMQQMEVSWMRHSQRNGNPQR
jgi:2-oxoglutarate ferredoxin oxidoreductase subunit gamma